eukprot:864275-Prymnesium_polylepis.1
MQKHHAFDQWMTRARRAATPDEEDNERPLDALAVEVLEAANAAYRADYLDGGACEQQPRRRPVDLAL